MSMRNLRISNSITQRESQSIGKYLQEINKSTPLTSDEEVNLAIRIRKGDKVALDQLTKANLKFVVSVAKQYQGHGLSLDDLINEGNLGLMEAACRFDETRGFRFISFAVWWIRQNILQAIAANSRMIRLPMHKVALSRKVQKARTVLEQQLERNPSEEELAEALHIEKEEVSICIANHYHHTSLDMPMNDDDEGSLLDTVENRDAMPADKNLCHGESLSTELGRSLRTLSSRQRETICYLFGIGVDCPLSVDEIAKRFDITAERVRQIKDAALSKLRGLPNIHSLRDFLAA